MIYHKIDCRFSLWTWCRAGVVEIYFRAKLVAGENDKMTLSAVYDDECTRFTISFQNQYTDTVGFEPIRTLALMVQFKPFAKAQFLSESDNASSYSDF